MKDLMKEHPEFDFMQITFPEWHQSLKYLKAFKRETKRSFKSYAFIEDKFTCASILQHN